MELSREKLAKILPKDAADTIFELFNRAMSTKAPARAAAPSPTTLVQNVAASVAWDRVTNKPTEFPPSPHQHSWLTDLLDIPDEFPPESHQHDASDITGEFNWIDFNTAIESIPLKIGRLGWDAEAETLAVYLPNGVRLQIGQEQYTPRSKNTSGTTILNGRAVYIKGASGNSPEVGLANASDPAKSKVIALATTDVANNNHGIFTTSGYVLDVDTSAWAEGVELFVSTTDGVLTNVAPSKPNVRVSVGYVVRSHATQGSILVSIHRQPTLEELGAADNEVIEDGKAWTGFADPVNTIQSYDPVARTVTTTHPSGTIEMWFRGRKLTKASPWVTPAHGSTVGTNWFFYSADGVTFSWSNSMWDFHDIIVAYVRYGTALKFGIRECHGTTLDASAHRVLHNAVGTRVDSGGNLTAGTFAVGGTASDANNTPGVDAATLFDEDLQTTVAALTQGSYEVVYPSGTGEFALSTAQAFPFTYTPGGYINWFNAGASTQGATTKFYCVYGVTMPSMADADSQKLRWIWIAPQAQYDTLIGAQAAAFDTLDVGDIALGITEYVPRVRLIFGANASYGSTGKVRLEEVRYLSRSGSMASAAASAALSGSGVPGEPAVWASPASLISQDAATFRATISAAEAGHVHYIEHIQTSPAIAWIVTNPLGRAPAGITVIDTSGQSIGCKIEHDTIGWTFFTVTHSSAIAGRVIFT